MDGGYVAIGKLKDIKVLVHYKHCVEGAWVGKAIDKDWDLSGTGGPLVGCPKDRCPLHVALSEPHVLGFGKGGVG